MCDFNENQNIDCQQPIDLETLWGVPESVLAEQRLCKSMAFAEVGDIMDDPMD